MAREIALLTNPTSGKGQGGRVAAEAMTLLRAQGHLVRSLQGRDAGEALDLARGCVQDGIETLVVVGGDGMIHLALQALAHSETRLGLVPAGTGNDVARNLGIPRGDTAAAVDVLVRGRERPIDLVKAGPTYFVTIAACGFDAIVNERANAMTRPKGQMRYNIATLAELRTLSPLPYVIDVDGVSHQVEAVTVAVSNMESFGGGLKIARGVRPDDGLLEVIVIGPISRTKLVTLYPRLFNGSVVEAPAYSRFAGRSVTVATGGITAYADGEPIGRLPLTFDIQPGALRVVVP